MNSAGYRSGTAEDFRLRGYDAASQGSRIPTLRRVTVSYSRRMDSWKWILWLRPSCVRMKHNNAQVYVHVTVYRYKFIFNKTNKTHEFSKFYFVKKLYMFRASPLPIIRSFLLYIRHWYISCSFDDRFQAGSGWTFIFTLNVLFMFWRVNVL
jgi:hypothetical protein